MQHGGKLLWGLLGLGAFAATRQLMRSARSIDLRGRSVLITGGSRGLGLALARQLADAGTRLTLCARDAADLERARAELAGRADVHVQPCDLRDRSRVEAAVRDAIDRHGALDVLINNAGVIMVAPMEEMTEEDYEEAMQVHYRAPLHAIRAALPHMRRRGEGRIVNITSIGGKVAVPHLLPYTGSKFALVGLSEGLRAELLKDGISVTTVVPWLMRTGSPRNAYFKGQNELEYAWFSIGDSIPGLTLSAESAAARIISAMRAGDAEAILGLPAKLAAWVHGLFPGLTADVLA